MIKFEDMKNASQLLNVDLQDIQNLVFKNNSNLIEILGEDGIFDDETDEIKVKFEDNKPISIEISDCNDCFDIYTITSLEELVEKIKKKVLNMLEEKYYNKLKNVKLLDSDIGISFKNEIQITQCTDIDKKIEIAIRENLNMSSKFNGYMFEYCDKDYIMYNDIRFLKDELFDI